MESPASAGANSPPQTGDTPGRVAIFDLLKIAAITVIFGWYLFHPARFASIIDPDVWWHIRTGEWIVQHHQLPVTDPFSATGAGKAWVAYSWPFELLIYGISKNWDLLGLVAYSIFGYLAITAALFHLLRGIVPHFWKSAALTFIGTLILPRFVSPRPGILTTLFFIVVLDILLRAKRSGDVRKLWLLPVMIWIWANVHVQFIYGLFVIGVFCIEPILNRVFRVSQGDSSERQLPNLQLWLVLAVSTALSFANPYGIGVYRVIADYVRQPKLYMMVNETNAMAFNRSEHFVVLFLAIGAAIALGHSQRLRPVWMLLLLWSAMSAFRAERDIWVVTVIALIILAQHFHSTTDVDSTISSRVWLAATACLLLALLWSFKVSPTNKFLIARVAREYPVGAVAYIREHHLQGPMFNNFDWGGFLIYSLPEIPVAIDGRTNVHGQDEVGRSLSTWNLSSDWHSDPLLAHANIVVGSPRFPLVQALATDQDFKRVFDDEFSVVFQRVLPAATPKEISQ